MRIFREVKGFRIGPAGNTASRTSWWGTLLAAAALPVLVYAFSSGPPSEHTGGFGEPTCTACHIGTGLNTGPGSITITAPPAYASGQTFPISVRVADPNQRRWGFELSARTQGGQQAGTLVPGSDRFTHLVPTFNGIQYIAHTSLGTRANTTGGATFTFDWQAPDVSAGPVVFHAAGNAANNGGSELGDRIYATSITVPPEVSGPAPSIFDGGIVNNASFAPHPNPVAPGSIAAIFGSNLNNGSQVQFSSFGDDGKLVTTLGGASVTVNGIAAPMFYSFPGQLGIQIPAELGGATSASVQVTVAGQTSAPRTIFLDSAAPGTFTFNQQGTGEGAITHADGSPVTAQNPARRNEVVILYATGLGAANPPLATGAPSAGNPTLTPAAVTVDGVPAEVQFSGTAPGFVGLNQINFRVPANARVGNDIPVVVSSGAKQSNTSTLAIAP